MTKTQGNDCIKESLRQEYVSRINRVLEHIQKNIDKDLSLEILANVAFISKFHFHRIFKAIVGETLNQYILRIRTIKAARQLIGNPEKKITDIALGCGFSDSATFARAFKRKFRMSASEWRNEVNSKKSQVLSKKRKDADVSSGYIISKINSQTWRIKVADKKHIQIEVRDMPELCVAYICFIGSIKDNQGTLKNLYGKLINWAGARGFLHFPDTKVLAFYPDDLTITEDDRRRTYACITVPEDTPVEGEIGKMIITGGKCCVARCELAGFEEFYKAWIMIYNEWMPGSGYKPGSRSGYEIYLNDSKDHPKKLSIVDLCAPIEPL